MTTETIEVKGKEVRDDDILFGGVVSRAYPGSPFYKGLSSVYIGGKHIWIDPDVTYTVEREVKTVRFKVGTVAKRGTDHIVRRENDWMHTQSLRTFWYVPEGDHSVQHPAGVWTVVYGGPEEEA